MGRIIRLHGDEHREVLTLLPWYVTGRLDAPEHAPEHAQVEAHLDVCAECQAEVRFQRRLAVEIADLPISDPPVDAEQGWLAMRRVLESEPPRRARGGAWLRSAGHGAGRGWRAGGPWLGWAAAAVMLLAVGATLLPGWVSTWAPPARYHALGAAPVAAPGNVVVIFRPDTTERTLRETLNASNARLVDGPTAADAYVLRVPPAERIAALAKLRGRADVVLAEPIDSGAAP